MKPINWMITLGILGLSLATAAGCHIVAEFDNVSFVSDGGSGGSGAVGGAGGSGGSPGDFTVRVVVASLTSSGLVLRLDTGGASESVTVDDDGEIVFDTRVAMGADYVLEVASPLGEHCDPPLTEGTAAGDVTIPVSCAPVVAPVYPDAPSWNDYAAADGTACLPSAAQRFDDCDHGGERRFVYVPGAASCAGLSAVDALGAFDWHCDASTTPVRMVTAGLAAGAGLATLLDTDALAWRDNHVRIEDGSGTLLETEPAVWWTNDIAEATTDLSAASTVYVVREDSGAPTVIGAAGVALVPAADVTLTSDGTAVVVAEGHDRLWVEGMIDAGAGVGVSLENVRMSQLHGLTVTGGSDAVRLAASAFNRIESVESTEATGAGVVLSASSAGNLLRGLRIGACGGDGVSLDGSAGNLLYDVVVSACDRGIVLEAADDSVLGAIAVTNQVDEGIRMDDGSDGCVLADVNASNNGSHGIVLASNGAILLDITTVNNGGAGVYLNDSDNTAVSNLITVNNVQGLATDYSVNGFVRNVMSSDNGFGIQLGQGSNIRFTGTLTMGNNSFTCIINSATGLVNDTCANNGASDANLTEDTSAAPCLAGKAQSDAVNDSDSGGVATFGAIDDWTHFAFAHRGWGKSASPAFPDGNHAGACTTGLCQIWDMSLVASDTLCRAVHALPSGSNVLLHDGRSAVLDAVEIIGDGIGDDDLLCESDEACMASPNVGAYQGHGELVDAGAFTDGVITGVTLLRYANNGVP